MEVNQIQQLVNDVTKEVLGKEGLANQDLTNVVDVGTEIFNANAVDAYVRSLVNRVGRTVFVNRPYRGSAPSVLMDGWEYGSVMEKIQAELPEAVENDSWNLQDGQSYDPNVFYKPKVSAKFFNSKDTFEIRQSITERQVKQSFSNAAQLNGFLSMLYNAVEKSMTVKMDSLVMLTIDSFIARTFATDMSGGVYTGTGSPRAVNLLALYNAAHSGEALTAEAAITTPAFIRFASYIMAVYMDRMSKMSVAYNIGGKERFTPSDMLHVVMLSDFKRAADIYLQSDTFHDQFTRLPNAETVPYWQAGPTDFSTSFNTISGLKLTTEAGAVDITGILGVMFDRDALGVCNLDRRVTTDYNARGEFWNNFHKFEAGYFNDLNENFVVFYVA